MNSNIDDIIYLIEQSALDQTIKAILVRDLRKEGLTDFLREQIIAYSVEGIKRIDDRIAKAKQQLQAQNQQQDLVA